MSEDSQLSPSSNHLTGSTSQQDVGQTAAPNTHAARDKATLPENIGPGTTEEGWKELSEDTYMCTLQPIKENRVFKGKHKIAGEWRDIAVKLIQYDNESYKEVQRHLKVQEHLELEENANIIRIYEIGELSGIVPLIFIAMELCFQNLEDFMKKPDHVFDFKTYFTYARQIVSGVAFLHRGNILHRDLKLENIYLSKSEDSVRVAGFGLSKHIRVGHSVATASVRGVGCDGYRAPELLLEPPKESFYSDTFSLGLLLAMLFSKGQHPFGSDPTRWRTNIADDKGLDLSHILAFEEPHAYKTMLLADLVKQCVRADFKERPTPEKMLEHEFFADTEKDWVKLSERTWMCKQRLIKNKVFEGKHKAEGGWRDIAIKLIDLTDKNREEVKRHLELKEHPYIIRMYETGTHPGTLPYIYIAMELCSQTLKDFIEERKQNPIDFDLYFTFAEQIVSGVTYIHDSKIFHRDIKLENILLTMSKDKIRVADFGLSKQIPDGQSMVNASARGIGSDGYRAPELLDENPKTSYYSDSFSLGIVLAMLFSNGNHPFGSDPARWRTNIDDNIGLDLSHILTFKEPYTHKRAVLVDLIEKCLKRGPRDRPTPKEMLQHGFFTKVKKVQPAKIPAPPVFQRKRVHVAETDDADTDLMEQFLAAKRQKVKDLEDQLKQSIQSGQANTQILEELKNLGTADDLDTILPLAEYVLVSKKDDSYIEKVKGIVTSAGSQNALDIRQKAYSFQTQGKYIPAMILYIVCQDLHKKVDRYAPDIELQWLEHRISDITAAIDPMIDSGGNICDVAKRYGIKHILELIDEVRAVKGASPGVKALHEIGSLVNVTGNLNHIRDHEKCIRYGEEGVEMMEREFGENAVFYKDYGRMLNNLGNAYGNYGRHDEAEKTYRKAIEIHDKAQDYENEEKRQKDRSSTTHNLGNTHHKIVGHPSFSIPVSSKCISRKIMQG